MEERQVAFDNFRFGATHPDPANGAASPGNGKPEPVGQRKVGRALEEGKDFRLALEIIRASLHLKGRTICRQ